MRSSVTCPSMGDFTADWLALREPIDAASRSNRLARLIGRRSPDRGPAGALDLACGTGSNLRYLADYLPSDQRWLCVDRDSSLLSTLRTRMRSWAASRDLLVSRARPDDEIRVRGRNFDCAIATRAIDLASEIESLTEWISGGCYLITASALLDLVSKRWLLRLASICHGSRATVLFALTYNGRTRCTPPDPEDNEVCELVNTHQRTDKGFGPALGPMATDAAEQAFAALGYETDRAPSDWVLSPVAGELQRRLIEGWAEAATTIAPERTAAVQAWKARRLEHLAAGRSSIAVGHEDLIGWPR